MKSRRLLMMALLPVCVLSWCATGWAADRAGVVVGVQGRAEAVRADGSTRALKLEGDVFVGEVLRTEKGARLQVMLEDDTLISLGEDSEVSLDEYVYDPDHKANNSLMLRVARGLARVITGIITDLNPDRFKVRTSRATIGIRGCELGFRCRDGEHRYFVVRVPSGRSIHVLSELTGDTVVFEDPGIVDVDAEGRLRKGFLQEQDIRDLLEETTPRFGEGTVPRGDLGTAGQEKPTTGEAAEDEEAEAPADETEMTSGAADEMFAEGSSDTSADAAEAARDGQDVRMSSSIAESRENQLPPPSSPPPPEPSYPRVKGGGAQASYLSGTMWGNMESMILYYRADGFIADGWTSVDFVGDRYDAAGHILGPVTLSLRNVPLIPFGGRTFYEGWREIAPEPGLRLANDNLQEFVRRVDLRGSAPQILYWGVPFDRFSTPGLPPARVIGYDVVYSEYKKQKPMPFDAASDLQSGTLRLNTKTGGYAILLPGWFPMYGRADDIQLYGKYFQGVGGSRVDPEAAPGDGTVGAAFAGFRSVSQDKPAESGVSLWRGYAAAAAWIDTPTPGARELHSADLTSDNPGVNEGRAQVVLDRDDPVVAVRPDMTLSETPPSPSPGDIVVKNPQDGIFVEDKLYSAHISANDLHGTLVGVGGGQSWSWGIWDGDKTIDLGGGSTQIESSRGHYVVGDTLSPAAFQALAMGSQPYVLQTPAGRPGHVSATLTAALGYHSFLEGEAQLQVTIPGGGMPATWEGLFYGGKPGGDHFNIQYTTPRTISPNGHLAGGMPDNYMLNANGVGHGMGSLTDARMGGNLVGPGTGPQPVTGAIGEGRFVHLDGTVLNLTYGTDLAP